MRHTGLSLRRLHRLLVPALLVICFELLIANAGFWADLTARTEPYVATVSATSGLEATDSPDTYRVTDSTQVQFHVNLSEEAEDEGTVLRTVYVPITSGSPIPPLRIGTIYSVTPMVRADGAMSQTQALGTAHVIEGLRPTHWLRTYPQGKVHDLDISVSGVETGTLIHLPQVTINSHRPFSISPLRVIVLGITAYLVWSLLPARRMYGMPLDLSGKSSRAYVIAFALVAIAALALISQLIEPARFLHSPTLADNGAFIRDEDQANHYANAIINGHLWLDLPVPQWLTEMSNPYDASARMEQALATGEPSYWDFAYFDGHYYSYFGIAPILALFVPFKLLTGHDLPTAWGVAILSTCFVIATFFFVYQMMRRYWRHASLGHYILMCTFTIVASGSINQVFLPKIYSLPMLTSMTVTLAGLGAWILASRHQTSRFFIPLLVAGALLIGVNLGGRPLFVLAAFLGPLIFAGDFTRLFLSRKHLRNAVAVTTPILLLGAAAMAINVERFGSPFDFGAKYNLTGFDMTHKPIVLSRALEALWMYLFQPLSISPNFPYIETVPEPSTALALTIQEPYYGGLIAFAPLLLVVASAPVIWKGLADKRPLLAFLIAYPFAIATIEGLMVSYTPRYQSDFAWALIAATIVILGHLWDNLAACRVSDADTPARMPHARIASACSWIIMALVLFTLAVSMLNMFATARYEALIGTNPTVYYTVKSWF